MAKKKRSHDAEAFAGGAVGAAAPSVKAEAAASDAAREGWELFRNKADQIGKKNFDLKRGSLFEYIESAKYNTDAVRKGAPEFHLTVRCATGSTPVWMRREHGSSTSQALP